MLGTGKAKSNVEIMTATPGNWAACFSPTLYYRPPPNRVAAALWRRRLVLETTTGISGIEPWERVLVYGTALVVLVLFLVALLTWLPSTLLVVERRTVYYFFGYAPGKAASSGRMLAGWSPGNVSGDM